jgi:hypothetical protein
LLLAAALPEPEPELLHLAKRMSMEQEREGQEDRYKDVERERLREEIRRSAHGLVSSSHLFFGESELL